MKKKVYRHPDKPYPGPDYECSKCESSGRRLWRQSHTMLDNVKLFCAECAEKDQVEQIKRYDFQRHPQSSSIGDLIPARPTPEGDTFWGHTSGDVNWWYQLKQYHDRDREFALLQRERDHYVVAYQYELGQALAARSRPATWQDRDEAFRAQVVKFREQGYGRMVQIVDEEWRKIDPRDGGLLVICRKCDTLIDRESGQPHKERTEQYDRDHPVRTP